jgi:hypothetical protein
LIDLHLHFLVDFGIHSPYSRCRLIVKNQISIQSPHNLQATHTQANKDTWGKGSDLGSLWRVVSKIIEFRWMR